ncbi:hypothetical protein AXF42_Ash003492 [Apostasia shenzhenica]|uniref:Uncharacterized protein n=1 Tax=Apostasia shenzhenica TaxID=1088818 RepID=A0A2I0BGB0_9ASPA|nr:hypothetical protein AXF42_Ash003492 [Apostasia shenzhenica]
MYDHRLEVITRLGIEFTITWLANDDQQFGLHASELQLLQSKPRIGFGVSSPLRDHDPLSPLHLLHQAG